MGHTQIFGMSLLSFCSCWKFGSLDCGWLVFVQLIVFVCLLVVVVWGKTNVILPGRLVFHVVC